MNVSNFYVSKNKNKFLMKSYLYLYRKETFYNGDTYIIIFIYDKNII